MSMRTPVRARVAAVSAALVAAGSLVTPPASSAQEPTPVVVFTESDSGRTVHVARGSAFRIRLVPQPGERWTAPQPHGTRVGVLMSGLQLDEQVTDAFFQARTESTVDIRSRTDVACLHATPACAVPVRSFTLTVVVDPGPEPATYPAAPALAQRPAEDAVELDTSNADGVFTVQQGQRASIRMGWPAHVVAPPTFFLSRWYLDPSSSQVLLDAVSTSGLLDLESYALIACVYDYPPCPAAVLRYGWQVAVGPTGSAAHGVSTALSHPVVTAGNAPSVTATLTRRDGGPAYGAVELYEKRYGETVYRRVGVGVTAADGTFRVVVRPTQQTAYVAVVRNVAGRHASAASVVQVHARVIVDHPAQNGGVDGPATVFTGALLPARPHVPVGVGDVTGGRFRYLAQGTSDADGRFLIRVGGLTHGWHVFVVYTSARAGVLRGSSRVRVHVGIVP